MESANPSLHYLADECIQRHFIAVDPDTSLQQAVEIMSRLGDNVSDTNSRSATCILVLDNQQLVGLLTERDLVRLAAQQRSFRETTVCEVMTQELITCQEWEAREPMRVIQLLLQHRIRHLPILNEQDQVVGLVTQSSICSVLKPVDLLKFRYVKEVMVENVIHAPPTTMVLELAQLMASDHVSCVVIGDEVKPGKILPVGIITERDIIQFPTLEMNLRELSAQQVMSSPLFFVHPDDSLWETHEAMQQRNVRRFVVANNEGYLVGILTEPSILQAVDIKEQHQTIAILQEQVEKLESEKLDLLKRLNCDLQEQVSDRNTKLQTQNQCHQLLADIAFRIRSSLSLETILQTTVTEVRELLKVERVIIYRFYSDWSGKVTVESVETPQWSILGRIIKDQCFEQNWLDSYQNRFSQAIADIHQAELSACHIEFLTQFQIKANLVVPISVDDSLWGLLIAHSCTDVRPWQPDEVEFLEQLSIQVANAIQLATLLEQVQRANTELEAKVAERTTALQAANQSLQQELIRTQQAEAALRKSEEQYRRIVETTTEGIWMLDIEGKTSFVNAQMAAMLGYSVEEMLGKPLFAFMGITENKLAQTYLERRNQGIQEQHDFKFRRQDGSDLWVIVSTTPIIDSTGKYLGALAMMTDITMRKHAEQELRLKNLALEEAKQQAETANQAKSEFLANMSHEIRTPMNAILGFADLLQSEVTELHIASYVQAITSSGRTLLALINDILDLSKIEAGKLELHYEPVDLRRLIREIFQIFSPNATDKNLDLCFNIEHTVPQAIYIDEVRLRQILFNVVGNALKFTDKGQIEISIRAHLYATNTEEKIWLEIAVEDTGIGIAREQQQRIFEAFFQSSGQSDRKYGGTGLGLAITRRLMNMMGGIITLQSELGKGSIFTFVFPAVSPATGLPEIVAESPDDDLNQFAPSTILVVDDVASNRELIKGYFHKTHHLILLLENGQQAINVAQLHHPHLILMDLRMPIMDGKETAQHLKQDEKTKNIPIVILTASSQAQEQYELEQICQGFLSKPISRIELVQELKKHLQSVITVEKQNQLDSSQSNTESQQFLNHTINLPGLLIKLHEEEQTVWISLRKTLKMRELKQFIQRLKTWGLEHQCQLLVDYADSLQTKLDAFDMEQLPLIIEQFPSVRQAMEALI
ncbi:MAG: hypothetical protein RLZZ507_622 [Cyanobacteriota bacterium]|jgi:PAS domain S-box-containing protein